jgi:hypothetical protein
MKQEQGPMNDRLAASIRSKLSSDRGYTLGTLVMEVSAEEDLPRHDVTKVLYKLAQDKSVRFSEPDEVNGSIGRLFFSFENLDFLALLLIPIFAAFAVFGPSSFTFVRDVRYLAGFLTVIILPGFGVTTSLYPRKELGSLQKVAYSVAISLVFVLIIGVILDNSPWGITVASVVTSFVVADIALTLVASIRKLEAGRVPLAGR